MQRFQSARRAKGSLLSAAFLTIATMASAQDIEPRAYSNAPTGVNFLIAGYGFTRGGPSFDPAVPVTNPQLHTNSSGIHYAETDAGPTLTPARLNITREKGCYHFSSRAIWRHDQCIRRGT